MNALASSRASRRKEPHTLRRSIAVLTLFVLGVGVSPAAEQAPAGEEATNQEVKPAVWRVREVRFGYNSSNTFYPCNSLQRRVESILLAVGAREDLEVRVISCDEVGLEDEFEETWTGAGTGWERGGLDRTGDWTRGGNWRGESGWGDPYERFERRRTDREQNAYVRVRLMMPVEVTEEVIEEIKRDKSRRELVSRVTGDPTAREDDPILFPARWQSVTLSRESIGLKPEECELLDQMSKSVFKELNVKVTGRSRNCGRSSSRVSPSLTVEALMSAPIGATSLPQIPTGAAEEGESGAAAPSEEPPR